jgi:hypothetical protein
VAKGDGLCETADLNQIRFVEGHIEDPPLAAGSCDTVISHGVINLSADKAAVRARQPISIRPGLDLTNGRSYDSAHRLVHGLHEAVDCPIADLGAVDDPLLDRLPEVEPDEDA